jgi:DNA mismatch repair protein MutS
MISGGRHPMVEHTVKNGKFVPNDTHISNNEVQIMILTAPNSCGKSTYLRQVALIVLLSQIGSFVPADSANISIVDRIFTRVGLQDHIAQGQSGFMVEMMETANILNNATPKSLIILDEIGRGTSTYDGLSISRAVIEFIHNHPEIQAKTLFATHYHELTELADFLPRVRNFHMTVTEEQGRIIFLRRLIPGKAGRSYGVQVAGLAGLPRPVIHRAQRILAEYEEKNYSKTLWEPEMTLEIREHSTRVYESTPQHSSSQTIIDELLKLDINSMTPIEALTKLYELQKKASE